MSCKQTDKAAVYLAANAQDPAIRALIVDLLNELQPEVDKCHQSEIGQKLRKELEYKQKLQEAVVETRKKETWEKKAMEQEAADTAKEILQPTSDNTDVMPDGQTRSRQSTKRYNPFEHHEDEYITLKHARQGQKEKDLYPCEICHAVIGDPESAGICALCFVRAYFECHGVPHNDQEFWCALCSDERAKKSESTARKGKGKAPIEDEAFEPEERQDNGDSDILQDASDNNGSEAHDTTDSESEYNEAALDDGQESEDEPIIIVVGYEVLS